MNDVYNKFLIIWTFLKNEETLNPFVLPRMLSDEINYIFVDCNNFISTFSFDFHIVSVLKWNNINLLNQQQIFITLWLFELM